MSQKTKENSMDPENYSLWIPEPGKEVHIGPKQTPHALPILPLPIHVADLVGDEPSDNAVGQGVYDYLREFPNCPHNTDYAVLLRDAFPHFLSDLGMQILMLEHKEVDSQDLRRKVAYMKILMLVDTANPGLLLRLGIEHYNLSQMFTEFIHSRQLLLNAMGYFLRVVKLQQDNLSALNYLAQIDCFFGDYPAAIERLRQVINLMEEGDARQELIQRVELLSAKETPEYPLIDEYENIGIAMDLYGRGEIEEATTTLEIIEEQGQFTDEHASPEFYYFLGLCRSKNGDPGGAFDALEKSLELDPDYALAIEAKDRFLDTGKV